MDPDAAAAAAANAAGGASDDPVPVLSVRDLRVEIDTPEGVVHAVDGVSYDLHRGETLGLVGESGCGKTVSALALLGLLPAPPARVVGGEVRFEGRDLLALSRRELRAVRGRGVAMVFQDPTTSLHPAFAVGAQIDEALRLHDAGLSRRQARARTAALLTSVGVPAAESRARGYPHQWSGGMRQRAMIAMAIANGPSVLVADEPTTALDVSTQAQVLGVLRRAQQRTGAATLLISHDLGVIAEMADRVAVMYAGRIVETGSARELFASPRHPYTLGLLASLPRLDRPQRRLAAIPGQPPSLVQRPDGCPFHPRCRLRRGRPGCVEEQPSLVSSGTGSQRSACHFSDEMDAARQEVEREVGARITGRP